MARELNKTEEQRLLTLSFHEFDQEDNGWRQHAKAGRYLEMAKLIDKYRDINARELNEPWQISLSKWHSGQMYAMAGDYVLARKRFAECYKSGNQSNDQMWNYYVDATLALLNEDLPKLQQSHDSLAACSLPDRPAMNLAVVEGFVRKFGKSYRIAYDPKY